MPQLRLFIALCACLAWISTASAESVIINWVGNLEFTVANPQTPNLNPNTLLTPNTIAMSFAGGHTTTPSNEPWNNNSRIQIDPLYINNIPTLNGDFNFQESNYANAFRIVYTDPQSQLESILAIADISLQQLQLEINNSQPSDPQGTHAVLNGNNPLVVNLSNLTLTTAGQALRTTTNSPTLDQIENNQQFAFLFTTPFSPGNLTQDIQSLTPPIFDDLQVPSLIQTPQYISTSFAASLSTTPSQVPPPNPIPTPGAFSGGIALFFGISFCRRRRN